MVSKTYPILIQSCTDPEVGIGVPDPREIWQAISVSIKNSIWTPLEKVEPALVRSIGAGLAPMTSLPVQDGDPHDFRSKMAAPTTSDPRWRPHDTKMAAPTTSDPRWRLPRREIQGGGPTKSDTRWQSL